MVKFKSNLISQKFTFNFYEILFLMLLNGNLQRGVNLFTNVINRQIIGKWLSSEFRFFKN